MTSETLKRQQDAAKVVELRMLNVLLQFEPTQKLSVADVKFIADCARGLAFDAIKECQP